jgi:hypothetical protein
MRSLDGGGSTEKDKYSNNATNGQKEVFRYFRKRIHLGATKDKESEGR